MILFNLPAPPLEIHHPNSSSMCGNNLVRVLPCLVVLHTGAKKERKKRLSEKRRRLTKHVLRRYIVHDDLDQVLSHPASVIVFIHIFLPTSHANDASWRSSNPPQGATNPEFSQAQRAEHCSSPYPPLCPYQAAGPAAVVLLPFGPVAHAVPVAVASVPRAY